MKDESSSSYGVAASGKLQVVFAVLLCPGYGGFDNYNGFNNYCFGNGMFDERVRGERGGRGKVQILSTFLCTCSSVPLLKGWNIFQYFVFRLVNCFIPKNTSWMQNFNIVIVLYIIENNLSKVDTSSKICMLEPLI